MNQLLGHSIGYRIAVWPQQGLKAPAILNLGGLLNGSVPPREDLPVTTMIPKRLAAKYDPADLAE